MEREEFDMLAEDVNGPEEEDEGNDDGGHEVRQIDEESDGNLVEREEQLDPTSVHGARVPGERVDFEGKIRRSEREDDVGTGQEDSWDADHYLWHAPRCASSLFVVNELAEAFLFGDETFHGDQQPFDDAAEEDCDERSDQESKQLDRPKFLHISSLEQLNNIITVHERDQNEHCCEDEKRVSRNEFRHQACEHVDDIGLLNHPLCLFRPSIPQRAHDTYHLQDINEKQEDCLAIRRKSSFNLNTLSHDVEKIEDWLFELVQHYARHYKRPTGEKRSRDKSLSGESIERRESVGGLLLEARRGSRR
mmetsp:Transcript_30944/g.73026  ORF Transcript_30944/g.73026 Transcript_30944/m.73026 type:complete len:306 (-) Transcript_30944:2-919(-)